jgi:hypothetical protein
MQGLGQIRKRTFSARYLTQIEALTARTLLTPATSPEDSAVWIRD